jgi:hypothetical protein
MPSNEWRQEQPARLSSGRALAIGIGAGVVAVILAMTAYLLRPDGDGDVAAPERGSSVSASGSPGVEAGQPATTEDTSTTSTPEATTTTSIDPAADQEVASRIALRPSDLGADWLEEGSQIEDEIVYYEAVPACADYLPGLRSDGATAIEGEGMLITDGQANASSLVAFFLDTELADAAGPDEVAEPGFRECTRHALATAVAEVYQTRGDPVVEVEALEPPSFGDKAARLRTVVHMDSAVVGQLTLYQDLWIVQIGRAVVSVNWTTTSEPGVDALRTFELVALRFEREMSTYE